MEQFLNTDDGTICFTNDGITNNDTLVFIHGFPLTKESWDPQVSELSSSFRILRYDLSGMGKSENSNNIVTIDSHVLDLIALMDHCRIDKCTLVGLSMGGYIALRAVNLYPNRFKSVVLANTRAGADSNDVKEKRFAQIAALKKGGIVHFAQATAGALVSDHFKQNFPEQLQQLINTISSQSIGGLCGNLMAMAGRQDGEEFLKIMGLPTLVITSDNDKVIPYEDAVKITDGVANAQLMQIKDAGHLSNMEQAGAFNYYLKEFLRKK